LKKILILGGSHRDIPLIKASQELGYYVITLGDKDYYLGHNYSDKSYLINFNDLEQVKIIIKDENIDFLLPGCGEESYLNTVQLSQELNIGNFDSLEVAKLIHNKWKFKIFCLENNISTPKGIFYSSDSDIINLNYPIVVKPTNLSGGRGVDIVNNKIELKNSIKKSQELSSEIFLEEFIDGELIAYSIILINQQIHYGFTGADETYLNKYLITTAYPIDINLTILNRLKYNIEKLAKLLDLVDGMFHLQILIKNNIPYIIDVTRRIPGDFYPNLIEYCDEVNYSQAIVKAYTTGIIDTEFSNQNNNQNFIIRHCIMPDKNGIFKDIYIDDILKNNIIFRFDLMEKNTIVNDYLNTQVAIVFIQIDRNNHIINCINNLIKVVIKE